MTPAQPTRLAELLGNAKADSNGFVTYRFDRFGLEIFADRLRASQREVDAYVCVTASNQHGRYFADLIRETGRKPIERKAKQEKGWLQ